jgi:hypothetical protein
MRFMLPLIFTVLSLGCTRGADEDATRTNLGVAGLAGQRAAAADRWMETMEARLTAGETMTPDFLDRLIDAAKQRAIARADASDEAGGKQAAYRAYRDFCAVQLNDFLNRRYRDGPPADALAQLRYAIADAEWRMGQAAP